MKARVTELEALIKKHKSLYYKGEPEISDYAYDLLEEELRLLDPDNYVLHIVGTELENKDRVAHSKKMLSLDKKYEQVELERWIGNETVLSTMKIDGMSLSLLYGDGKLQMAKTRGDGEFGEELTHKAEWIDSIPKRIALLNRFEVRGELFCSYENFEKLTVEMKKRGLETPNSSRNIVAGLIGRKEHLSLCSYLTFMAFDQIDENCKFVTEEEKLRDLKTRGFNVAPFKKHMGTQGLSERIDELKEGMESFDYAIDGLVFTYNEIALHDKLGETSHHPRYKMAYKIKGESRETSIERIIWQVSRNGILTPVAEVTPIELSGAIVQRVTLHNLGVVLEHKLKAHDQISIIRSGEVIPKFLSVSKSAEGEVDIPKSCVACGYDLEVTSLRLYCHNQHCSGRKLESLLHFITQMGIEDISEKRVLEMVNKGLIKTPLDLYSLTMEQLLSLDKFKEKMATKILRHIDQSRKVDLQTFLSALGLAGVSKTKIEKLIFAGIDTLDAVLGLTQDQLMEIEGFAERSSEELLESLLSKRELIVALSKLLTIEYKKIERSKILADKSFCITGQLTRPRAEIEAVIKLNGGKVVNSVTKKTSYLVTNEINSNSSKYLTAIKLALPIITQEDLFKMLEE